MDGGFLPGKPVDPQFAGLLPPLEQLQHTVARAQSPTASMSADTNSLRRSNMAVASFQEDEALRRLEALHKLRKMAAQAAEVAIFDAEEMARAEAEHSQNTAAAAPPMVEVFTPWPPISECVPADYDVGASNAPLLRERAGRVMDLGDYWSRQEGSMPEDTLREALEKAGGHSNLAKLLKKKLEVEKAKI